MIATDYIFGHKSASIPIIRSYYQLNEASAESVTDYFGRNPGNNNGCTIGHTGVKNSSYKIVSSQNVQIPYSSDFDFGFTKFSFSVWIKFISVPTNAFIIGKTPGGTGSREWELIKEGSLLKFRISSGASAANRKERSLNVSTLFTAGNWFNIICTYDGSGLSSGMLLYFNGAPSGSEVNIGNTNVETIHSSPVTIGNFPGLNGYVLNGYIDEIDIRKNEIITAQRASDIANLLPGTNP